MTSNDSRLSNQDVIDACVAAGTITAQDGASITADLAAGKSRVIVVGTQGVGKATLLRSLT